ncbi:putative phage protein (TIGR02218 family) [Rhodoligotrophos appendicifer]|uniref:DUF2163 domain-containing protein n=1 Tax=Rhodoligotrophos appendicifer TaxID=987056 RepID=UPI001184F869|nr:DUF2163 domain-containing protein [Rhodoligotrophos appendicifer]
MRALEAGLQAHLDSGATTLAWCWKLTRRDGLVLGFTDHDCDLEVEGTVYAAGTGFTAGEIVSGLGLSIDTTEAEGALSAAAITEPDILAGLYDDAEVEILRVNWADPSQWVALRYGNLGEVRRGLHGFTAEIRGLAHRLNRPQGRLYQVSCDAVLGDGRCGVDLDADGLRAVGEVAAVHANRRLDASGLETFPPRWFEQGRLIWTTGANVGVVSEIKTHRLEAGAVYLELWIGPAGTIAGGDHFTVEAGCDKRFTTCRAKFGNGVNFRGFPHMPTNDFVMSYPSVGDQGLDGGSLTQSE